MDELKRTPGKDEMNEGPFNGSFEDANDTEFRKIMENRTKNDTPGFSEYMKNLLEENKRRISEEFGEKCRIDFICATGESGQMKYYM